jgi:hypothetical protein
LKLGTSLNREAMLSLTSWWSSAKTIVVFWEAVVDIMPTLAKGMPE